MSLVIVPTDGLLFPYRIGEELPTILVLCRGLFVKDVGIPVSVPS